MEELLDAAVKKQGCKNTKGANSMISIRKSWESLGWIKPRAKKIIAGRVTERTCV